MYHPKNVFENPKEFVEFFISEGFESQFFERKEIITIPNKIKQSIRKVKEGIRESISAFANYNQDGGLIVVGINDKTQEVTGIDHLSEEQLNDLTRITEEIQHHATIYKPFSLKNSDNQEVTIGLFYTPYTKNALCQTPEARPKAWKRSGKQNLLLSEDDRLQILRDKGVVNWENMLIDEEFDEEYLDEIIIKNFKRSYLKRSDYDLGTKKILRHVGAIRKRDGKWYFTNAGLLFFDESPQRLIPQATVRFLRYDYFLAENPHRSKTSFDRIFSYSSIPNLLQRIRNFCQEAAFFRTFTVRNAKGHLQEFQQFPLEVVEEGIINAVMHRDYAVPTEIFCKLYKDAFVVENAGRILQPDRQMPTEFTLEDIELVPYARNKNLMEWAKTLYDEQKKPFVRAISEGTRNMKEVMQKMYFPYPAYHTNGVTRMTLEGVETPEEFAERLKEHQLHKQTNMKILYAPNYEIALKNLEKFKQENTKEKEKLALTYNLVLQKSPDFQIAKNIYEEMKDQAIPLNEFSYNILINKCEYTDEIDFMVEDMLNSDVKLNVVLYNTLINKSDDFEEAKVFFEEMKEQGLVPDEISYNALINKSDDFEEAKVFFEEMKEQGLVPDEISYNTLINKSDDFEEAEVFFEEMKEQGLVPDEISYNTLINKSDDFEEAKVFFEEMKEQGLVPDEISYNALINKSDDFEEAKFFFEEMQKEGLNPNEITYTTLIKQAYKFNQAKPFYDEFLEKFPLQNNNKNLIIDYNYLFTIMFRQVNTEKQWLFLKDEVKRLGLKINERTKSLYKRLQKKYRD